MNGVGRRARLLAQIDQAWRELKESYSDLLEAELTEPGVAGQWSVKDILAHISTWEEESLKYLPLISEGGNPPLYKTYGGIDAFNALMNERKRALSLSEVLSQLDETHRRLVGLVQSVPEGQLGAQTRFCRRLRLDTYGHYREHARAIREWRDKQPRVRAAP